MEVRQLAAVTVKAAEVGADRVREIVAEGSGWRPIGQGAGGDTTLRLDKASEDAILSFLMSEVGAFAFLGEERGYVECGARFPLFIVDPVDGSFNASRGIPPYSVSVAVATGPRLSDVKAGAVVPVEPREPAYWAIAGAGAFRGGLRISPRPEGPGLGVVVSYSKRRYAEPAALAAEFSKRGWKVRTLGCASLEVCLVATGQIDAYVNLWGVARVVDLAAALLIARESGCPVYIREGDPPLSIETGISVVVARSKDVARAVLELARSLLPGLEDPAW